jgi:hypothetical protein
MMMRCASGERREREERGHRVLHRREGRAGGDGRGVREDLLPLEAEDGRPVDEQTEHAAGDALLLVARAGAGHVLGASLRGEHKLRVMQWQGASSDDIPWQAHGRTAWA